MFRVLQSSDVGAKGLNSREEPGMWETRIIRCEGGWRSLLIARGRSILFGYATEKISELKSTRRECKTREKKGRRMKSAIAKKRQDLWFRYNLPKGLASGLSDGSCACHWEQFRYKKIAGQTVTTQLQSSEELKKCIGKSCYYHNKALVCNNFCIVFENEKSNGKV